MTKYRVNIAGKMGVPYFGPPLPTEAVFEKGDLFRTFLLLKLVNGERAAMRGPDFKDKMLMSRQKLLTHMCNTYGKKE